MNKSRFHNLDEILQRLLDNQIEPEEMERLQKAICEDARIRQYYMDSMLVSAVTRRSSQQISELAAVDKIPSLSRGRHLEGRKRVMRYLYATAAVLILGTLIFTSISYIQKIIQGPAVGVLTGVYEAQWKGSRPRPGGALFARTYTLNEGAAQMELHRGVSLLLEAPCRIELKRTNEMRLTSGRLTVQVAPQAIGFEVRTRTALVTDLGTDFGVVAYPDGSTETHVLKGRVSVALDPSKVNRPTSQVINQGQAAEVDADGRTILGGLKARTDLFLLKLPVTRSASSLLNRINLADIVGGGNGRGTGTLDKGIDLRNGQVFQNPATSIFNTLGHPYQPCLQIRGIDGVFMPNGAFGPIIVSTTGLVFSKCPRTLGTCFGGPANSGKFYDVLSQRTYTARLHGVRVGTSKHPALSLHSNAGITFDLDEIRQDHPNIQIDRFTALCGIPKNLPHSRRSSADVWVLLDGNTCLRLHFPIKQSFDEQIDVPIPAKTRFLTLVTTCSGRADFSWILFYDPYLGPVTPVQQETSP